MTDAKLTATQRKILALLPATPYEIAQAICNVERPDQSDRLLVHVHMTHLRAKARGRIWSTRLPVDGREELGLQDYDRSRKRYWVDEKWRDQILGNEKEAEPLP